MMLVSVRQAFYADSRDTWQQPDKVMEVIGIRQGMVIGEPGAGKGYFTFKLARKVGPTGKIYANDIDGQCLTFIAAQSLEQGLKNNITIKGKVGDPLFPVGQMDMVFMSYVVHDLAKPVEFLKNLKPAFKPGAQMVILEQDPEKYKKGIGHFFTREKLLEVVKSAGYVLVKIETFLPRDNIYIFRM
jgi:tRNA A58 N-methylase Trm61